MAFDGNGVFNRLYSWRTDAANGVPIDSTRHDAEDDGFAVALSNCMTRDGQAPMIANLPLGNKRIINMADPVNAQDAANKRWVEAAIAGGVPSEFAGDVDFTADAGRLAFGNDLTPDNEGDIQLAWEDAGKGIFGAGFKMSGGTPVHSKDTTAMGGIDFGYGVSTMFASTVNTFAGEAPSLTVWSVVDLEARLIIQNELAAKFTSADETMSEEKEVVTLEKLEKWYEDRKSAEHPVGSIWISNDPTNPADYIGFTSTWVQTAQGRAIVGAGSNGQSTWAAGDTRGSETHTLTEAQLASHAHTDNITYSGAGGHGHNLQGFSGGGAGDNANNSFGNNPGTSRTNSSAVAAVGDHVHPKSGGVLAAGGNQPHNNIQPSIATYVWLRTA